MVRKKDKNDNHKFLECRFTVPESMHLNLLDLYIKEKNWESALNFFRLWNDKVGLKVRLIDYENLIFLLAKEKKYVESLSVFEIAKKNGHHQHNLEIRLLLKTGQHDKLLGVFRNAVMLNFAIDEKVGILYVRKLFEILQNEKLNFSYITDNLKALNEEQKSIPNENDLQNSGSKTENAAYDIELLIHLENDKLEHSLRIIKNVLSDLEEVTSNLVYLERGSNESFNRVFRLWREGGVEFKDRYEVCGFCFVSYLDFFPLLYINMHM